MGPGVCLFCECLCFESISFLWRCRSSWIAFICESIRLAKEESYSPALLRNKNEIAAGGLKLWEQSNARLAGRANGPILVPRLRQFRSIKFATPYSTFLNSFISSPFRFISAGETADSTSLGKPLSLSPRSPDVVCFPTWFLIWF